MKELIRYMYYRFAHVVRNRNLMGRQLYDSYAKTYLMAFFACNLLVIVSLFLYFAFNISLDEIWNVLYGNNTFPWLFLLILVAIYFFICCFVDSDAHFYKQLDKKYKNEKHRVLKGWLLALYCIVSFALLGLSFYFLV